MLPYFVIIVMHLCEPLGFGLAGTNALDPCHLVLVACMMNTETELNVKVL